MYEQLIWIRNKCIKTIYKRLCKPIFFRIDPEVIHDTMTKRGKFLGNNLLTRKATQLFFCYKNRKIEQTIAGIKFSNPIGLAAGFDKNAELTQILPHISFGYIEVGSITGELCGGNPKPRLWRLPKSQSLIVYYGLKNNGAEAIAKELELLKQKNKMLIPLGISIAKTNCKETAETSAAIADYCKAYSLLESYADYITINISCPNAFGGQPFTNAEDLNKLLKEINKIKTNKQLPIFLKLSPDIITEELDKIIEVSRKYNITGFICSNLTKNRDNHKIIEKDIQTVGGLSGKVVEDLTNKQISYICKKTKKEFIIIGCGGVFSAEDAYKKIKLGASLIQLITGMIYEGPQAISEINQGLVKLLEKDGYNNISEAVGKENSICI
ncbi:quinone-dependent dihydroorotate dehydrogenase [Candidatus Woesearchaeota archaeon]|nr:quinone-dependent dihydroorotate dehydrogenase [Candidatus Woesearchaeota archaeon]